MIHGAFRPKGAQLTARCWGSIDIASLREDFRQPQQRKDVDSARREAGA